MKQITDYYFYAHYITPNFISYTSNYFPKSEIKIPSLPVCPVKRVHITLVKRFLVALANVVLHKLIF